MADASRKRTAGGVVKVRVALIPHERIERRILLMRGQKVLLDTHLARFYGVSVGRLNGAVKRNLGRFPSGFVF